MAFWVGAAGCGMGATVRRAGVAVAGAVSVTSGHAAVTGGPPSLALAVVQLQAAFDPWAPWLLAGLLLLAWWLAWRVRCSGPLPERSRAAAAPLLWLAGALCVLATVLTLTVAHGGHAALQAWDDRAAAWGAALRAAGWRPTAARLGAAADVLPMTALALLVAAACWARQRRALAVGWLMAVSVNSLWGRVLKDAIARPRPATAGDTLISGLSFPSGHTTSAMMVFGLLGWLLCRRLPPAGRSLGAAAVALLIAAVGASRLVLGVHYVSDVLGGLLWSGACLCCAVVALQPVADRR